MAPYTPGTDYAKIRLVYRAACPPGRGLQMLVGPHAGSEAGRRAPPVVERGEHAGSDLGRRRSSVWRAMTATAPASMLGA
jgi:hypothetical protein